MTLNTRVLLRGPVSADLAFDLAVRALLTAAGEMHRLAGADIHRSEDDNVLRIGTVLGQGLPAITDAEAHVDGSEFSASGDDLGYYGSEPWNAELSWDTAYGYRTVRWGTCSELHAAALVILKDSLPEGVNLRWCNEFTGDWHDDLAGLTDFATEGRRAEGFAETVRAVMTSGAAA